MGLPESNFFVNPTMKGHNQLLPHPRRTSMTFTLNSDILLRPSPMPPLQPLASKSMVCSNHVKITLWAKKGNVQSAKRLYLVRKFLGKAFLQYKLPIYSPFGGKQHWLLIKDISSNYIWSFFLKDKFNLVDTMVGLIKNLKNQYSF